MQHNTARSGRASRNVSVIVGLIRSARSASQRFRLRRSLTTDHSRAHAFALLATLVIAGCGGGASKPEPVSAALVVGQGQDQVDITVRSGSEVVLNGENSDGARFPIETAQWEQTDSTGIRLQLDKRTELTRAFRVPDVTEPTTFTFELTVTNTDGDTKTTPVSVHVIPVGDRNRFLEFFRGVPGEYTVVAALQPGTTTTSDVHFTITQTQLVDYPDRTSTTPEPNQFGLEISAPESVSTHWPSGITADWSSEAEAVNAFFHPNVCFSVPKIDIDDINVHFDDTDPDRGIAEHHRDAVNHQVQLSLTVDSGTCADASGNPIDCQDAAILYVLQTNGELAPVLTTSPTVKSVPVGILTASDDPQTLQPESADTAEAYYAAVDPFNRRLTFGNWLQNAGFLDGSGNFVEDESIDHVLYINNFDLGFTRDMFVRRDPSGDVFAYVTNYPALRPAVLKQDVIATVAMEYAPPDQDPTADRIVKFFVFVPDGENNQRRVKSLNFDGRGEKFVPGACVPCHGGELKNLQADGTYPAHGDLDAAFLPWDIDSLLYVDANNPTLVDPLVVEGFELNPDYISPDDMARFSLENQQDALRRMNEAVLTTMKEKPGETVRFALVREQVHGWYGNLDPATFDSDDLPDVDYNDRAYIQEGWAEAGLEDVYHEVFARHCRICHSQAKGINQFRTLADLQALAPRIRRFVYEDGTMPNARLDMDRFWVDFRGAAESPAHRFAMAMGFDEATAEGPGRPIARIKGSTIQTVLPRALMNASIESVESIPQVENEDGIRLDGSISSFADSFDWAFVTRPAGSTAALIGADTAKPAFMVDAPGTYVVQLTASNARGPDSTATIEIDASSGGPKLAAGATLSLTMPESIPSNIRTVVISTAQLQWIDPDSADGDISFTITTPPTRGTLSRATFTQQDINDGLLTYTQDPDSEGPTDQFTYTVSDEAGNSVSGQQFDINITTLNDEPVLQTNGPLNVAEGATAALTGTLLWTDIDDDVSYTVTSTPLFGALRRVSTASDLSNGATFDQADIDGGDIVYAHNGVDEDPADTFAYTVTDGTVVVGPTTFDISIANVNDVPQLRTNDLTVPAALDVRISGGLSSNSIPSADLSVVDSDTTDPADITLTLESAPTEGTLEIRGGAPRTLTGGGTFTLAEVITGSSTTGLFYVSGTVAIDPAPTDDTFSVSVADTAATGTCANAAPAAACTVNVDVTVRNDGPTGSTSPVTLSGFLDAGLARIGATLTSTVEADVPWGDVQVDDTALNFVDTVTGDAGECPLEYSVVSAPAASSGFLKRGTAPLSGPGDPDVIGVGETFTHAEVQAGTIFYENRAIGGGSHSFVLDVTDCLFTIQVTLTVDRSLDFTNDVGWVIDTIWDDADDGYPFSGVCPPAANDPRGCRECHAPAGCAGVSWTDTLGAGGVINCLNLEARFPALLPNYPTNAGHGGGVVIQSGSFPHQILQNWNGDETQCP